MRDLHARLRVEGLSDEESAQLPVQITGSAWSGWRYPASGLPPATSTSSPPYLTETADTCGTPSWSTASRLDLDGIVVRVAALDDVIASREWATGRRTRTHCPSSGPSDRSRKSYRGPGRPPGFIGVRWFLLHVSDLVNPLSIHGVVQGGILWHRADAAPLLACMFATR